MKIRGDFVTNSSSVSFVLSMKKEIVDIMKELAMYKPETGRVYTILKEFLLGGDKVDVLGEELYVRKIKFKTDGDCKMKEWDKKPVDFDTLSDDEVWEYIFGDYLLNGELARLHGFGATQTDTY